MADRPSKKASSGNENRDRKNHKAWKKGADGKPAPPGLRVVKERVRTPERQLKDEAIRVHRERRRELSIERHRQRVAAEKEIASRQLAELERQRASERAEESRREAVGKLTGLPRKAKKAAAKKERVKQ